jgi:anti-sigma factor ChrR (cupin superfamily)
MMNEERHEERHIDYDELELYASGLERLPHERLVVVEEHLLICPSCCATVEQDMAVIGRLKEALRAA